VYWILLCSTCRDATKAGYNRIVICISHYYYESRFVIIIPKSRVIVKSGV